MYDPTTGAWKYADDSVEGRVTGLVDVNSPLIQQARTQGMQAANRRGLINSSIAVGASQDAAYKAAVPIATADANITSAKNLSAQGAQQNLIQGQQTIQGQKDIQGQSDVAAHARLVEQLGSAERVAAGEAAAAKERLGLQLTAQEQISANELKAAQTRQDTQNATTIATTDKTIAANAANTDKTLGVQTQQFVVTATQQARGNANSLINAINSNPEIPYAARGPMIDAIEASYQADIKVIASVANVQIPYTPPKPPPVNPADALSPYNLPGVG